MTKLQKLKEHLNISNQYEMFNDHESIVIRNKNHKNVMAYINYDQYTPGHPLEITDDGNLLDTYERDSNHQEITPMTKQIIKTILAYYHIGLLDELNEIVMNTSYDSINLDVSKYLKALNMANYLLSKN